MPSIQQQDGQLSGSSSPPTPSKAKHITTQLLPEDDGASAAAESCSIIKPSVDNFNYRIITLPNGLRAILVQDPETDKAAASLDVCVGSMSDPLEFPGLAHFTEHMLFMGSEKYPDEDEYSRFVSDHGGHTNAWTASENTNYQFDVNWEHLAGTLDRFAQFFICPLIKRDAVDREIKAVDSEHGKNLSTDAWRQLQLAKHTANQEHPWSRFSTGNLETLGNIPASKGLDIREAVVDFHRRHYSANLMRLAVLGRQSLDDLEVLVRGAFGAVPNQALPEPVFAGDVFTAAHTGRLLRVVPVREGHSAEWAWQVPPSRPHWRSAPLGYLSHLLGHEGEGSLFALLKARGWAQSLVAGESGVSITSASFFYVRVELTEEGLKHIGAIGAVIFRYLALLSREGVAHHIWTEIRDLQALRFNFRDKQSPYNYTTSLSSAMQEYPDKELLLGLYHVPQEFDPAAVHAALACLTPAGVRLMCASKTYADAATDSEPWYGTKYVNEAVPAEWMALWEGEAAGGCAAAPAAADTAAASATAAADSAAAAAASPELHLPAPNPFIPTDFTLCPEGGAPGVAGEGGPPEVVVEEAGRMRMWHKCDTQFSVPKAVVYLDFQCPEAYASPDNAVMTRLFVKLVGDALNALAYPAELAGLSYGVHNSQAGFQVIVSGYNHRLGSLLQAVLDKIEGFKVSPDRFSAIREEVAKEYRNMRYQQPYQWAMYRRELLLSLKRWRVEEYEEIVGHVSPGQLQEFFGRLMSRCCVEGLVVGNMGRAEAVGVAGQVEALLTHRLEARPVFPSQLRDSRVVKLPAGATSVWAEAGPNPNNDNSAVLLLYQTRPDDLRANALLQLLSHMAKRDAFNTLRTQQQLGYIVSLFWNHEQGVGQLEVVVQSTAFGADTLAARAEAFIASLVDKLLPERCTPPAAAAAADAAATGAADASTNSSVAAVPAAPTDSTAAPTTPTASTEFHKAVAELSKSKLEKPKRLGEVAQRLWNEIHMGTHRFDRQAAEVAALRELQPQDLLDFAHSVLRNPVTRRKLLVSVRGSAEAARAAAQAAPATEAAAEPAAAPAAPAAPAAAAAPELHDAAVTPVTDITLFKRCCEVHPSVGALAAMARSASAASLGGAGVAAGGAAAAGSAAAAAGAAAAQAKL